MGSLPKEGVMDNCYIFEEITVMIIMAINEISLTGWSRLNRDQ